MGPWLTLISTSEAILLCVYQPSILSVLLTFIPISRSRTSSSRPNRPPAPRKRAPISSGNTGGRTMARTGALVGALLLFALISGWHHHLNRRLLTTRLSLLQNCHEHLSEKARVLLRCTRVPPTHSRFPRICQPPASAVAFSVHQPPRFSSRSHGCKRARSPHKDSWVRQGHDRHLQIQMSPLSTSWDLRIISRWMMPWNVDHNAATLHMSSCRDMRKGPEGQ